MKNTPFLIILRKPIPWKAIQTEKWEIVFETVKILSPHMTGKLLQCPGNVKKQTCTELKEHQQVTFIKKISLRVHYYSYQTCPKRKEFKLQKNLE